MFKRIISFLLVAVIGVAGMTGTVNAAAPPVAASPNLQYTYSCSHSFVASGTNAICISRVIGYNGITTRIVIMQVLEKKNSAGEWKNAAVWHTTIFGVAGELVSNKTDLASGTYRLKSVFYVYSGGNYETITKYSSAKTI